MLTKKKILKNFKKWRNLFFQKIDEIHRTQTFDINREYIDHSTLRDYKKPNHDTKPQKTTPKTIKTQVNKNKGKVCSDSKILRKVCQEVQNSSIAFTLSKNKSLNWVWVDKFCPVNVFKVVVPIMFSYNVSKFVLKKKKAQMTFPKMRISVYSQDRCSTVHVNRIR